MTTANEVTLTASAARETGEQATGEIGRTVSAGRAAGATIEGDVRGGLDGALTTDPTKALRGKTVDEIIQKNGIEPSRRYRMRARPLDKPGNDIVFEHERALPAGTRLTSTGGIMYRVIGTQRVRPNLLTAMRASMGRTVS